jgi:hypothetical protein
MKKQAKIFLAALGILSTPAIAAPTNYTYAGTLTNPNQVLFFNFNVAAPSTVTLRTWSYAGGTNAAGVKIDGGGFDPILALFDAGTGIKIGENDDGDNAVAPDPVTQYHFDTYLSALLSAGNYVVSVAAFSNFSGATLSEPFAGAGDFSGRDTHWAFDILNVETATQVNNPVPEPTDFSLISLGLAGLAFTRKRR